MFWAIVRYLACVQYFAYSILKGTVIGGVYLVKPNRSQGFARRGLAALKYIFI